MSSKNKKENLIIQEDKRKEIRLIFESKDDPLFKKIITKTKKSRRSPANEVLVFLEEKFK